MAREPCKDTSRLPCREGMPQSASVQYIGSSRTRDPEMCPGLLGASVTPFLESFHRKQQTQAWSAHCDPSTQGAEAGKWL